MSVLDLLRTAPQDNKNESEEEAATRQKYSYWRIRIFYSMYIGYAFYYFTRKSFTFAMPAMMATLGMTKVQLGALATILSITYGLSKFLSGVISDKSNPRYFMAVGLIFTGILNILFGMSSAFVFFALFWGLNGWFQGWGWPPCAKLLTHWYSQSERGRWWGVWNTSHNVGGALIPLIAAFAASHFGWRFAMFTPGVLCILVGFFLMNRLRDTPRTLGLPSIEKYRNEAKNLQEDEEKEEKSPISAKQILFDYVIKNKLMWILACAYFFVYVIRTALNDWVQIFLFEAKGLTLLKASTGIFWFEIGGFFGSLAAGWASDSIFGGRRGPVNAIFSVGVVFAILGLWAIPSGHLILSSLLMFLVGFLIFGPQMLIGMAAAELSHKRAAGTASGFVGWIGYLGAASAGMPIGYVCEVWGWTGFFIVIGVCSIISVALLAPFWNVQGATVERQTAS